ncbi:LOW QUALITY PROTEIN: zf-CCHC domain-containing protein/MP domain-containing protein [Cephalotus follicularis]|uniref:Zf-CCHC domain-containing protein/MP domain-containing protein n=1 Tax=Cephalotus follicularis TaxID=3775 RepID=A0A1Q3BRH2_CEPFO|nr:LOW QUALITY PROTEIN: zf-CCHC domain-containing protein/MP domain-containing protein [Cephalotus follicularis]
MAKLETPKDFKQKIYKYNPFDPFNFTKRIQTIEQIIKITKTQQNIQLLDEKTVKELAKNFKYIHFDLVQVTIKPLTRQGLNTSILACLRDARHLNFDDSLIGAIEPSLCNGPVYFDGYPDLTISLTDKNILETLKINIKLHGYNMLPGSEIIAIIHHVHYKATNSICPKSLVNLLKGETTMMKCVTNDSNILIPQIKWSDINIPEDWSIQSDTIAPNQENIENTSLHSITQNEEGLVKIRFDKTIKTHSTPEDLKEKFNYLNIRRRSVRLHLGEMARESGREIGRENGRGRRSQLPDRESTPVNPGPPTDGNLLLLLLFFFFFLLLAATVRASSRRFPAPLAPVEVQRVNSVSHDSLPAVARHSAPIPEINERLRLIIPDSPELDTPTTITTITSTPRTPHKDKNKIINVIQEIDTSSDDFVQESTKQLSSTKIDPLKIKSLTSYYYIPTYPDLQIEEREKFTQASYQSGTIYEWNIDGMNEYHIINKLQEMAMVSNTHKIRNDSDKAVANILIAGFTGQIKGCWDNVLTTQEQTEILEAIQVNELKEPILDSNNEIIEDAVSTLIYNYDFVQESTKQLSSTKIDPLKIKSLTSYYYIPTYPDLQIEEREKFTQASYQSGTIYEWNIDGMNEYHIINKLQEMAMVSNTHKIRNDSDKAVANILIAGFTGQIKGCWDNVLTTQEQTEILEAIQVNELKEPILDRNSGRHNNIANYFVGDPTYLKDRTADQLSNLRGRKLQDFRWYKDTFMTKVLTREDANQPYWKEKFITGLPTLFAEKTKNKYREKHKGIVPYEQLTYGDIVSTITKTGLEICYDIKMSKQIKKDSKTYKKELGDFCTQFGYETFKPPPSKNLEKHKIDKKHYYKKQIEKPEDYKRPNKRKTHFKTNNFQRSNNDFQKTNYQSSNICYNCGRPGHIAKYCKIRKQIKKPDLSEDHRNQLFKIIDNQSPEESDYFPTSSTKIQAIKNSTSESEPNSDNLNIKTCNCNNRIIGTTCDTTKN